MFNSLVRKRAIKDDSTALRLKYSPYYHHFERQDGCRVWLEGREMIQLSSNDYLGLNQHPKVIEAGQKALKKWGASSTGSRISNGGRAYHQRLEDKLADFLGTQDCHIHAAGYLSCMSSVQGLANRNDIVFADRNIHSSLWSGIGMSRARVEKFSHNNPSSLLRAVELESPKKAKILVFEGVYSMEGHIAPLPEFLEIAKNHDLFTVMDDAHGVGVIGETGRGTTEYFDCVGKVDLICGSLSKALATTGGYVAGDKELLEYMRTHSKQTIFSAAISPAQAAWAEAARELIKAEPEHLTRLINNTKHYKNGLEKLGINTWGSQTAAVPLIVGDRLKAYRIWKELITQGVFTTISLPPSVPPNKELLRTAISAAHTIEDIDLGLDRLATAFNKFR